MDELKKVKRIIGKLDDTVLTKCYLVLDARHRTKCIVSANFLMKRFELTGLGLD